MVECWLNVEWSNKVCTFNKHRSSTEQTKHKSKMFKFHILPNTTVEFVHYGKGKKAPWF